MIETVTLHRWVEGNDAENDWDFCDCKSFRANWAPEEPMGWQHVEFTGHIPLAAPIRTEGGR